jgi:hypothetical protein
MSFFLHDSDLFNDENVQLLFIEFGYTGVGLFYTALEKIQGNGGTINSRVLLHRLGVNKKLMKHWKYIEELGMISTVDSICSSHYLTVFHSLERMNVLFPSQWISIRKKVFERDNFTCQYCGETNGTLECDHIIAFSKGGSDDLKNLTTACRKCNRQKKDKSVQEFIEWKGCRHG